MKLEEAKVHALKKDPAVPQWQQDFNAFHEAADKRKLSGKSLDMASLLEDAGLDYEEWRRALAKARKEIPLQVENLYENVLGRKLRGPNKPKEEPVADETPEEDSPDAPPSPGEILNNAYGWLEQLPAGSERRRVFAALGILLDIPEARMILREEDLTKCPPKPRGRPRGR